MSASRYGRGRAAAWPGAGNGQSELLERCGHPPLNRGRSLERPGPRRCRPPSPRACGGSARHVPEDRHRMGSSCRSPRGRAPSSAITTRRRTTRDPAPPIGGGQEASGAMAADYDIRPRNGARTPPPSRVAISRRSCWPASWTEAQSSSWSGSPREFDMAPSSHSPAPGGAQRPGKAPPGLVSSWTRSSRSPTASS